VLTFRSYHCTDGRKENVNAIQRLTLVAALMTSAACQARSCGPPPQRLDFSRLATGDRIEVTTNGIEKIATIMDEAKIQDAARFIERYPEGWAELWSGPAAPSLILEFYQANRPLGGYGIGRTYVVVGMLSREAPAAEVAALAGRLGLRWPPER
jgi:hypothetical protein